MVGDGALSPIPAAYRIAYKVRGLWHISSYAHICQGVGILLFLSNDSTRLPLEGAMHSATTSKQQQNEAAAPSCNGELGVCCIFLKNIMIETTLIFCSFEFLIRATV